MRSGRSVVARGPDRQLSGKPGARTLVINMSHLNDSETSWPHTSFLIKIKRTLKAGCQCGVIAQAWELLITEGTCCGYDCQTDADVTRSRGMVLLGGQLLCPPCHRKWETHVRNLGDGPIVMSRGHGD